MLIVIPVCSKDQELVLKNLDWIYELDGKIESRVVVTCPDDFDYSRVLDRVRECFFDDVKVHTYGEWGGDPKWPQPQNWAFQSTARRIVSEKIAWLWWEADATPVKKGWYNTLEEEYERGGKPFMGHVTQDNGSESHMAGVGIYPPDVGMYSTSAMLCRSVAFDIVMSRDTLRVTHRANHLIQHYRQENGDSMHFSDQACVESILEPGVVLFHRCKDGSLIDRLRNPRSVSKALKSFFVKPKTEKHWPSILKQTNWTVGFFDLPSNERECHFNPAIIEANDLLWLVSRRWRRTPPLPWTSDIARHLLDAQFKIVETRPVILPRQRGIAEQHEDPRIISRDNGFLLGYCSWILGGKYQAHQSLANLDSDWTCLSTFHLIYGNNGPFTGAGNGHEKNWTWFFHEKQLHLDYQFSPHIVLTVKSETNFQEHSTDNPFAQLWKYGHIRGGTPPVRMGEEYISFFHSSMKWRIKQNRYFMGACAFEAKPPFRVTRITKEPLLVGSEDDPRILGGPLVVFPCGAIYRNDEFLVTLGVNDECCAWIKIPKADLFERFE